ncbi:aldose epimerase family protein [Pararhodobacter aggregans]|uniref:aldose epimerase family protein n=1 Tax=Pararhodobacter aggregans TaxID=404875 RepID=UPI003A8CDA6E
MAEGQMARAVLRDGGVSVTLLSRGAAMQDWRVTLNGRPEPVILGYADPAAYARNRWFMGAIVGRVANRIGDARYPREGGPQLLQANDGNHLLHGGAGGLWAVDWLLEPDGPRSARFTHRSPDGAMGFPGAVTFTVTVTLRDHAVTWDMQARAEAETPISLAQHNYYALTGGGIAGQRLRLNADRVLDRDAAGIMTGAIHPVDGGPLDYRTARALAPATAPADDFLLFDPTRDPALPVAELSAANGLRLRMWSDQPGAQLYTGQGMGPAEGGLPGRPLAPAAGLCIEPSGYPNAPNRPAFPSILCSPNRPYRQRLTVEIAPA